MAPKPQEDFIKGFLDDDESNEEQYDSEEDELQKGGRKSKRRKLAGDDGSDVDSDGASEVEADDPAKSPASKPDDSQRQSTTPSRPGARKKSRLEKEAARSTIDAKNSGVIYLSRIPPFMKPQKLRSLLEPYGKIGRTYLAPEDPEARKSRVRNGGNRKVSYTEGWVEFMRKSDAKKACDLLNTRPIGGKKGSFYYDDIWTMLYLKGFKWHHLTEQMEAENKERESRLRAEIEKTTRENEAFVRNIEKAKMLKTMDSKRKRVGMDGTEGKQGDGGKAPLANGPKKRKTLQPETKQPPEPEGE